MRKKLPHIAEVQRISISKFCTCFVLSVIAVAWRKHKGKTFYAIMQTEN